MEDAAHEGARRTTAELLASWLPVQNVPIPDSAGLHHTQDVLAS